MCRERADTGKCNREAEEGKEGGGMMGNDDEDEWREEENANELQRSFEFFYTHIM